MRSKWPLLCVNRTHRKRGFWEVSTVWCLSTNPNVLLPLNMKLIKKRLTQLITWDHHINHNIADSFILLSKYKRNYNRDISNANTSLVFKALWCCNIYRMVLCFPFPLLLGPAYVTSRSRQPSAMPGPGVKKEIFKSKFDMIWTLICLMFESQVGTKDVEWI